MEVRTTTRCCSALALAIACAHLLGASPAQFPLGSPMPQSPVPPATTLSGKAPLSPFPSRTHYTLELNNQLVAPPAYKDNVGYFPIEDDRIVAFDLNDGTQLWLVSGAPLRAPAVGDGLLFISQHDKLTALNTRDGMVAWETPFTEPVTAPLFPAADLLIVATATELQAFRAKDGSRVWQQPIAGVRAGPTAIGKQLYVPLNDKRVLALRADTGGQIWERKLGGEPNEIAASGDRLILGTNDNFLYSLKTEDGSVAWHSPRTGADIVTRPLVERDRIFFVSLDNVLRALNRSNGVQLWKKALPFRPIWAPILAGDTVIVSGVSGSLRAFALKDGAVAGEQATDAAGEIAAAPYAFASHFALGPIVVVVTRTVVGMASLTVVSKAIEPAMSGPLASLPGVITIPAPKS